MNVQFYQDDARRFLIYQLGSDGFGADRASRIAGCIPDARDLGNGYVAVPRTLYNCQLLRWLELPVAPIMDRYDWPHNANALPPGAKCPTDAQKVMANFLALNARAFNLSDMGTMKTMAALWAADFVMEQYPRGECRALIVCPISVMQRVWGDALANHFMGRRSFVIVHHSDAERRRKQLAEKADFYIINPDGLKVGAEIKRRRIKSMSGLAADLYARTDIKIALVDEASDFYRDQRSGRHTIASLMLHPTRMPYTWLQTGTPTPTGPPDAYGLAKLVNDAYGESYTNFHRRTMVPLNKFKFVPSKGGYAAAAKLLQPAVRFAIEQVWDGPPCTIQQRDVPLSPDQHKLMAELKRQLSVAVGPARITPVNEAGVRTKALQILQGAIYDGQHNAHEIDAGPRFAELVSLINQSTRKTLVFVPLTSVVNLLCSKLSELGYGIIKLNGDVEPKDRSEAISRFKVDETVTVAICDPGSVAHGINEFVAATTVVWYGPIDKTEHYIQGNKRAHRPGQKFPVTIVQLVASALERGIFKRLDGNETMQGVLLDWIKGDKL